VLNPDVWFVALDALLASGPQLFSVASVGALTLPQVLPPQTTTDWVVVGAGVLFLAYSLRTINQKFDERAMKHATTDGTVPYRAVNGGDD